MLAPAAMLGAAAEEAAAGAPSPPGPDGPPTSVSLYGYSADLTGVQWVNGDPLAWTDVGKSNSSSVDPTSVWQSTPPGGTTNETGETCTCFWYARHNRNSQVSAWVLATGCVEGEDCTS